MAELKQSPAWMSLIAHRRALAELSLRSLFERDPHRFRRFAAECDGLLLDYSKNRVTEDTLRLLLELARDADLEGWRARLFAGEVVNRSEGRPALHMALRSSETASLTVGGVDVRAEVRATQARMAEFVEAVRSGEYRGFSGETISDVIHIGIGGSDLGPRLLLKALAAQADGPRVHFVANLDGVELSECTAWLDPARTLVLVASKSFGTQETLANAEGAREWFRSRSEDPAHLRRHFIGITANVARAEAFGIERERIFPMWDWVGGRYSLWSAVGLPMALACGMPVFRELLAGAERMDRHFVEAPLERNLPVLLALLGVWHVDFMGCTAHAVVPYSERLALFPAYLQQLEMESNGKSVDRDGRTVDYPTVPVIWGQTGTPGQHAFFQALHQGTQPVPVDFIGIARDDTGYPEHHRQLMANLFAQSEALMRGQNEQEARELMREEGLSEERIAALLPFRVFSGDRPSNTLLLRDASATSLGQLIALYEHKVFCQSVIWRLNAFDQWGVELGKRLAERLLPALADGAGLDRHDASTRGLIERYRAWRDA